MRHGIWGAAWVLVGLFSVSTAGAETVSYSANLQTSKGNPVTDILILEAAPGQPARATPYPHVLPGSGTVVISHDSPIVPSRSLIIGLTDGTDENGVDKIQLIMFLDPDFAGANDGGLFSTVFPGARHNDTINRLKAAVAGDAAELAWFADTFFAGPAAGAAFATGGRFVVAEFTGLNIIGNAASAGNWMITSFQSFGSNDPNAQSNRSTARILETAKVDTGPFDIELSLTNLGEIAFDKSVLNNTGVEWRAFRLILGTGLGPDFVPSTDQDALSFLPALNNREETGAFPNVAVGDDEAVFTGSLNPGGTARFVVFVRSDTAGPHTVTLRQIAVASAAPAPALSTLSLVVLVVVLGGLAALRLRQHAAI
jgi:hypothetical protein